jgi:hypothetical protein
MGGHYGRDVQQTCGGEGGVIMAAKWQRRKQIYAFVIK